MANPSGRTFHYAKEKLNDPGFPGIVREDGSRVSPNWASNFANPVSDMLRDHPLPVFLGAMVVGYLAGCLLSKC